ncbi:MAG: hypothetical protein O7B26_09345 [Planctomycetota bacterium]|nr:hypothetical protein [Planctomycetota bacterium]
MCNAKKSPDESAGRIRPPAEECRAIPQNGRQAAYGVYLRVDRYAERVAQCGIAEERAAVETDHVEAGAALLIEQLIDDALNFVAIK